MDPVTLYAPDGRSVVVRSAVEATNLRMSGYRDEPPGTDEVNAFLAEHPELADGVLAAEAAGRNRTGITGG
jgi:hypothetical protein